MQAWRQGGAKSTTLMLVFQASSHSSLFYATSNPVGPDAVNLTTCGDNIERFSSISK
jgi:hypothetical protein